MELDHADVLGEFANLGGSPRLRAPV